MMQLQIPLPASHTEIKFPRNSYQGFCEERLDLQIMPSVVKEAGLGQFAYLQGKSGRRYVFSAINADQVCLYEKAVFAFSAGDGKTHISTTIEDSRLTDNPQLPVYVHLLSDDCCASSVMADLCSALH